MATEVSSVASKGVGIMDARDDGHGAVYSKVVGGWQIAVTDNATLILYIS